MHRVPKRLLIGPLIGLALVLADCKPSFRTWVPPEEYKIKIVSDPLFIRTIQGDYIDGYMAEYESKFRKERAFVSFELLHYVKGERLIISAKPSEATVRLEIDGRIYDEMRVYIVERASPNIPSFPGIPTLK